MKKAFTNSVLSRGIFVFLLVMMSGYLLAQNVPEWMYFKFDVTGNQPNSASAPVGTNPAVLTGQTTGGVGQFGTALVGNGLTSTSNRLSTGWATALPATGWTISFWLNNFPATSSTTFYYFGDVNAGSFRCFTGGVAPASGLLLRGTGLTDVPINSIPSTPTVIHLVYTGSAVKVFKNGVLDNTVAQSAVAISGAGPFLVGGYSSSNSINAGTLMDEFRLYNRALTDAEVLATWNNSLPVGPTGGTLTGVVTNSITSAPIAGATISVATLNATSAANGSYTIANVPVGSQTVTCSAAGYLTQSQIVTITLGGTTTRNFALAPQAPIKVGGTVTDASTGAPVVGAIVTVGTGANAVTTMTIAGGTYLTPQINLSGSQPIVISKTGFDDHNGTVTLVANTTTTYDAALLPTAVQPGPFTAALNNPTSPTAVNLNWGVPQGMYQLIYDDGTQDNFAIWANANNLNALKFTPLGWPVKLVGGKVNLGTAANYPSNALPFTKFKMLAYKADGAGGIPGTIIDSVEVTPTDFGWVDFTFANPITINSGDFYLVMKQGGVPPHAAGIGVDLTNTQLRSYSKFVTGGGPWVPAAGNFMMRAILQGTGGPLLTDNQASDKELITASAVEGLIYEKPVSTVTGYEGIADAQPLNMSYQVWRLQQGQEGNQALWTSIWTGSVNNTVDNSWPTLPNGPYRWAVKAIYSPPGQRPSAPTFSNVIGKGWIANVNVCVALTCAANPKAGTIVKLVNSVYPDTSYTKTTDTSGCVHFTNVWKGTYVLSVTRFTYPVYTQNVTIMGDANYNVTLLQDAAPPTNLVVDNQSLHSTWSPPRATVYQLNEDFASGNFTTNQWVVTGGTNWSVTAGTGNPAPSAMFNWTPQVTNYHQYLTSKSLAGLHAPIMKLKYDIYLSNFGTTNINTMAVELWNGTTWTVLKSYQNDGDIPWTSETLDITSATHNPAFKIRFHAAGADSYDINNWNIDNIKIYSSDGTSGPNPCVIGYNYYLNGVQVAFTPDTMYNIPPNQVVYGQNYQACVKAVYGSGYSPQICVNFQSKFLYPARDLTATGIECNAYLTWKKPQTMTDAPQILSMEPRPVDANSPMESTPWTITTTPYQGDNTEALWDLMFAWPAATNQETGVVCIGDFIYTCSWSLSAGGTNWFHKYNKTTGTVVEQFDIPGVTANRDFAFDGTNAYAAGYTSTISKLDLASHTVVSTLSTSGAGSFRHLAYDPVNNGFWGGDWTTMFLVSATTGAVIATGPAQTSAYGCAYDADPAGPYLWVHAQNGAHTDELQQFKITGTTLTATGLVKDVGTFAGFPSGGSAGGLETVDHAGKFGLLGGVQNLNWVFATELRAGGGGGGGGTPAGLIGYNIYRGGSFIHYNPHPDSITYYDYGLNPGTYKYDVKAKYDLTSYGFPGQTGESLGNTAGEKTVTLNCGAPLPFYEPWDLGTFAFQSWAPTGHWTMNSGIGNPAPSADFVWSPAISNYSQALTSEVIDASAWTCAKIWLDFDYKLIDRNNTGKEKLTIDIFYGGSWHQKAELTNNGSTAWLSKHIDITNVLGKSFRIRFVANGVSSADILHWYVDNIHAYGICTPAKSLAKTQSQFTTTLTWTAPNCQSAPPTQLKKLFQWAGTPDNGYFQNYNYAYGVVYDLATYPDATLNKIDFHHASWGTTGTWQYKIHIVNWATFAELAVVGPLTTTGDDKWENNVLLGNIQGVGGKMIGIMLEPLSNSPTDAYPCFSADNVGPDGVSVFGALPDYSTFAASAIGDFLQNLWIEIPAGDNSELVQPHKVTVNQLQATANTRIAPSSTNAPAYLVTNQSVLTDNTSNADSSVLVGYNVYRTAATGVAPYNKLNASPITATTYVDTYPSTLVSGTFKYFVTVLYKNSVNNEVLCEPSTDTIMVTFPAVGMNELTSGQIMIYPNPATEVVNIKSDYTITGIDVMNFVGQTVYTISNVDAKTSKLNVVTYKPGVYFVKVTTTEGIRTVKITVTH